MATASARITLAMLRFVQRVDLSDEQIFWWLWPEGRRIGEAELGETLEAIPKPLVVGIHLEPGDITAFPLASTSAEGHARLGREWHGQQGNLRAWLTQLVPGGEKVPVLLELHDREIVVSSDELARWANDVLVTSCSWMLVGSKGDARAPLRMLLRRPDGTWSPGYDSRLGPIPPVDEDGEGSLEPYANLDGESGVQAYQVGQHYVRVQFHDGGIYRYTCDSAGPHHIEMMKQRAAEGRGLNGYINEHVRKNFAMRER